MYFFSMAEANPELRKFSFKIFTPKRFFSVYFFVRFNKLKKKLEDRPLSQLDTYLFIVHAQ